MNSYINRQCAFFAEHGLPFSDQVWRLLNEAWKAGHEASRRGEQQHSPFEPSEAERQERRRAQDEE